MQSALLLITIKQNPPLIFLIFWIKFINWCWIKSNNSKEPSFFFHPALKNWELPRISYYSFPSHSSIQFSSSTPHLFSLSHTLSLPRLSLLWFLQWQPLQTLGSQLPSTFSQPLPSCWLLLFWESNPSMIESTFQSGISVEIEAVQGGLVGILWENLWTSISELTSLSWTGCHKLSEWVSLRLLAMLALTLLLSLESILSGTFLSFYTLHINFHFFFFKTWNIETPLSIYGWLPCCVCFQLAPAVFCSTHNKITIFLSYVSKDFIFRHIL